jgi:hypothetical protein
MWWIDFNSMKEAEEMVGGLSAPSKMPSYAWSISAKRCNIGSKLAKVEGSVCNKCYALKGRYMFPMVQNALEKRYWRWSSNREKWTNAMIYIMHNKKHIINTGFFRWFDSGDIQGEAMLSDMNTIAWSSPHIRFWLPTKEYNLVKEYKQNNDIAPNLIIRVSNPSVNSNTLTDHEHISTVYSKDMLENSEGYICPSSKQGNKCGECRMCWSDKHEVSYIAH